MKHKFMLLLAAFGLAAATSGRADILISGMVDGTQTGGLPKAMEIVATTAIADLSEFWVIRDTNGAGPFDTFVQLPSVSLTFNEFFYVYGNTGTTTSMTTLGFPTLASGDASENGILNWNGDDILGLATPNGTFTDGENISEFNIIDSFGVVAQGDTDFAENSISYRPDLLAANSAGVTDAGNFVITAYSDAALQSTFGTHVAIPEPSSIVLMGLTALAAFGILRRRKK